MSLLSVKVISNQKGVSIVAIIATMLILSTMGAALISLVTTGSDISVNQLQSVQVFNIAEGGREYIVESGTFPNYYTPAAVPLGSGSFTVSTPTWLTADLGVAGTTINVQSTAELPYSGRIVIDSEMIDYTDRTGNSFTGATRGIGGTLANAHPADNSVYPVTDLTADPGAAGTTITVSSTTGFVIPGVVKVESEYLYCTGSTALTFTGCQRGFKGSTALAHVIGSNLFQYIITSTGTAGNAQRVVRAAVDLGDSRAIVLDTAGNKKANNSSSMNWNHNVSGTNRLLIVGVSIRNDSGQTVSSVFYNTSTLSPVPGSTVSNGTNVRVEMWYMINPSLGNNSVIVTLTGSADMVAGSVSLTDVDQTSPIDVVATPATGTGTAPTVTVTTTADGAWVIDTMGAGNVGATIDPSQTPQWNARAGGGGNRVRGTGSTEGPKTPPGNVTMNWTLDNPASWAITAVSVKPAPGNVALLDFREVY